MLRSLFQFLFSSEGSAFAAFEALRHESQNCSSGGLTAKCPKCGALADFQCAGESNASGRWDHYFCAPCKESFEA